MPSLADQLKSMGVKIGAKDFAAAPRNTQVKVPIESVVDGRWISTRRGEAFVYEQTFASDYHHGSAPLSFSAPLETIAAWMQDARLQGIALEDFAFLDTETSGLAGGTGTYTFLVGVGRFEAGGAFRLQQFFMRDPAEEPALLDALTDLLATTQALVTFNGKAFDAPLLRTRYSLNSLPVPFANYPHLDLLPLARRLWRDRLPSRALKYLEENVLGTSRTVDEVPGYEIPYIYFDYLRSGDATPLKGVFYHNAMDVVALAALMSHMATIIHDPFDGHVEHGLDFIALARLLEDVGKGEEAARLYERGLEAGVGKADFGQAVHRLSTLQRRVGNLEAAVKLWEKAAADGHIYAHVELAKHFEHRRGDPAEALKWTNRAMELVDKLDMPRYEYRHWKEELTHRLERLEKKTKTEVGDDLPT